MATAKRRPTEDRRELILDAAGKVFFEQGFSATSVDAIIARVGGSKRTIYNEFGSKEGLFTALVERCADKAVSALIQDEAQGRDLRTTMMDFGSQLLQVYQTEDLIGIFRSSLVEAERFPRLARTVYEKGPGRAASHLARILEDAKARNEIKVTDCASVANHFVSMIRGNQYLKVVLGLRAPLKGSEANAFVKSAVDLCLDGIVVPTSTKRKK
jgi:AcrR family transcriptional regulator